MDDPVGVSADAAAADTLSSDFNNPSSLPFNIYPPDEGAPDTSSLKSVASGFARASVRIVLHYISHPPVAGGRRTDYFPAYAFIATPFFTSQSCAICAASRGV